jgi:glycosyltransferase involved in cell wall biosynthesis
VPPRQGTEQRAEIDSRAVSKQDSKNGFSMITFAEGATIRKGGIGIAGIPLILGGTALSGNRIVTVMGGPPIPGRNDFFVSSIDDAVRRPQGSGTFGIVSYKAWTTWAFSPRMFLKIGKLVKASDFVGLHSLYSFPVLAGYLYAKLYGKPFGIWLHGVLAPFQRRVSARKKWFYDRLIARKILDDAAVIFFTARGEREEVSELNLRAPSVVVPHGFIADEFANLPPRGGFRTKFLNGHTGPLVVFLGRLNAKKGIDLLVRAMGLLVGQNRGIHLALAGPPDPPLFERQVRNWIAANRMEANITLTGAAGPNEKLELLADADVFVMPSHAENFGFGVFEAMASRVPVVVSKSLNYANEIAACEAGLAVERSPEALAQAIGSLLDDRELCGRMGANGVRMARRYSWEEAGANIGRVVQSILQHKPLPDDLIA